MSSAAVMIGALRVKIRIEQTQWNNYGACTIHLAFLEELTSVQKGGNNENGRVAFGEIVLIHLKSQIKELQHSHIVKISISPQN